MLVTNVDLVNGSQVLLIEDFFPEPLITELLALCATYPDPSSWTIPFGFDETTLRRSYSGASDIINRCREWLGSTECKSSIEQYLGCSIDYNDLHLWCDVAGVSSMAPHKEQGGQYLAQFFITGVEHSYTGTTIYNDDGRILFQMPYRNNYGWFFNRGTTVMHGREHPVPEGIHRFSMLVWYQTPIVCN